MALAKLVSCEIIVWVKFPYFTVSLVTALLIVLISMKMVEIACESPLGTLRLYTQVPVVLLFALLQETVQFW